MTRGASSTSRPSRETGSLTASRWRPRAMGPTRLFDSEGIGIAPRHQPMSRSRSAPSSTPIRSAAPCPNQGATTSRYLAVRPARPTDVIDASCIGFKTDASGGGKTPMERQRRGLWGGRGRDACTSATPSQDARDRGGHGPDTNRAAGRREGRQVRAATAGRAGIEGGPRPVGSSGYKWFFTRTNSASPRSAQPDMQRAAGAPRASRLRCPKRSITSLATRSLPTRPPLGRTVFSRGPTPNFPQTSDRHAHIPTCHHHDRPR